MADGAQAVVYREIPGVPGYRVGDDGSVWSARGNAGWRRLKLRLDRYGYQTVSLPTRQTARRFHPHTVHSLVLLCFVGLRPTGLVARHLNGDRGDNRLLNLRYGSHRENMDDRRLHGNTARGSRQSAAKLTEDAVSWVIDELLAGSQQQTIADQVGVSFSLISRIAIGKNWRHVRPDVPRPIRACGLTAVLVAATAR